MRVVLCMEEELGGAVDREGALTGACWEDPVALDGATLRSMILWDRLALLAI